MGKNRANGDKPGQPRAKFRGKYDDTSYVSFHGQFTDHKTGSNESWIPCSMQDYAKREELPWVESPLSGPVGPALDWSIRVRNLPNTFIAQMRDNYAFRESCYRVAYKILFPRDKNYNCHAKDRPKTGHFLTKFWTDHQVETWTKLAYKLGVQYSGKYEYSFRSGTNGYSSGGRAYSTRKVPSFRLEPVKFQSPNSGHKRSSQAAFKRSLNRLKRLVVKPIPLSDILSVRRSASRRTISKLFKNDMPISTFVDSFPKVLSLSFGPAFPVSQPVMDSLRKIYSRPCKMIEDKSWISVEKPFYTLSFPKVTSGRSRSGRLTAYFSTDGNIYVNRATVSNLHSAIQLGLDGKLARSKLEEYQDEIDKHYSDTGSEYNGPSVLGSWDSW